MNRHQLMQFIADAKAEVRAMKKAAPHLFPEWQRLENAKAAFKAAQRELLVAQQAWDNLGREPNHG